MLRLMLTAVLLVCLIFSTGLLAWTCYEKEDIVIMWNRPNRSTIFGIKDAAVWLFTIRFQPSGILNHRQPNTTWQLSLQQSNAQWRLLPRFRLHRSFGGLILPLYLAALVFAGLLGVTCFPLYRRRRRRKRKKLGLCVGCGYDLRGSSGNCPECGAARG